MASRSLWGLTPRRSIEAECARRGRGAVTAGCIELLRGRRVDDGLVLALAGPAARGVLDGANGGDDSYWLRVWGARGLLWAWDDTAVPAVPAVVEALADGSWRVREMAAKVVARHLVGDALAAVVALTADPTPRVRTAAVRAVTLLAAAGA
jgi:hypothetical protein